MSMILSASRVGTLQLLAAASKAASGLLGALAQASNVGRLWLSTNKAPRVFDSAELEEILEDGEIEAWRSPRGFTNALSLHLLPNANDVGTLLVRIGEPVGSAPGLALCLRLDPERFDVSAESLVVLVRKCAECLEVDEINLRPAAWRVHERLAWARWSKGAARARGSWRAVPCAGGEVRVAHGRTPAEEGPEARRDAEAMRDAVVVIEQTDAGAERVVTADEPALAELDGTREIRDFVPAPALPFGSAAGSVTPPSTTERREVARVASGTEDVDVARIRAALLPFGAVRPAGADTASPRPELSLEDYAFLRASLTIHGEDDAPTLAQFGIRSADEKRATQARFAAVFRGDPGAQERFVSLVKRLIESLPRSGSSPSIVAPEPDLDATTELSGATVGRSRWPFQSTAPLAPTPESESDSKKREL